MVAALKQVEIGGLNTERDRAVEKKTCLVWRVELWSALQMFVECYVDAENGLKKHEGVAYRLNQIWETEGRGVTPGALKNALEDANRNNFRLEWAFWFASQDEDIAKLLGMYIKPAKTDAQEYADLVAAMREFLSHKLVEQIVRRGRAM